MPDFFFAVRRLSTDKPNEPSRFKVGNVEVTILPYEIQLRGSLTKLGKGHNAETASQAELALAIDKLVEELGPEILDAQVFVLEIGVVIETEVEPATYLKILAKANRKQRYEFGETMVSFGNKNLRIIFYDKSMESIAKGVILPPDLAGKFLLRVEVKLLRRIKGQFGRPVFLKDLADPTVLRDLVRFFLKVYDEVLKPSAASYVGTDRQLTAKLATDELLARYLHQACAQEVAVDVRSYRCRLTPREYERFRNKIFSLVAGQTKQTIRLRKELDSKINEQCLEFLVSCVETTKEGS